MAEWRECVIGDICDSISETYNGDDAEVVLINTSDVLDGKILNHKKVENKNLKGQFKKTFKKDDILYSEIRPANKRYAYVDFENTSQYIASTKLMVLRPDKEKVIPRFLFAVLQSKQVIDELHHLAETRSGTFPQITFGSEVSPMPIRLPDLRTQRKIVDLLDVIEEKIELNNKINNHLAPYLCEAQIAVVKRREQIPQPDECLHTDDKESARGANSETAEQFSSPLAA